LLYLIIEQFYLLYIYIYIHSDLQYCFKKIQQ